MHVLNTLVKLSELNVRSFLRKNWEQLRAYLLAKVQTVVVTVTHLELMLPTHSRNAGQSSKKTLRLTHFTDKKKKTQTKITKNAKSFVTVRKTTDIEETPEFTNLARDTTYATFNHYLRATWLTCLKIHTCTSERSLELQKVWTTLPYSAKFHQW